MSKRVLITLLITFVSIFASFVDAFYGLLGYAFWSYSRPQELTWGSLPFDRFSYVVGLIVVVTTLLQKKKLFIKDIRNTLSIIFLVSCFISLYTPYEYFEYGRIMFRYFSRTILISLLITVLINNEKKLNYYFWAIVIFIGFIASYSGIRGGLGGFVGSAKVGLSGPIGERNYYAAILCMAIPIIFFMGNLERNKWLKLLLRVILVGNIFAVIVTYSRGGFLALVVVILFMFIKMFIYIEPRKKILFGTIGVCTILIFYSYFLRTEYKKRVYTIFEHDETEEKLDMSIEGRLMAWRCALEMIRDYPFMGVGFEYAQYKIMEYPDPLTGKYFDTRKAIHNIPLHVAAEEGIPAAIIYITIFLLAYRSLYTVRKNVKRHNLNIKYWHYASMLQVAFIGYFTAGIFINASYLELPWNCVGLTVVLEKLVKKELEKGS